MNKTEQLEDLLSRAVEAIKQAGGVQVGTGVGCGIYALPTPCGELRICPSAEVLQHGKTITITLYCKWVDIERAKAAGFKINPFTGKWNHHALSTLGAVKYVLERATRKEDYEEIPM